MISNLGPICPQYRWNSDKIESKPPQLHCKQHRSLHLLTIDSILLMPTEFMFRDFKFTIKNQNLPKRRIVAEFFYETPIRIFLEVSKRIAQLGRAGIL